MFLILLAGIIFFNYPSEPNQQLYPSAQLSHDDYELQKNRLIDLLKESGVQTSFAYIREQLEVNSPLARDCHPLLHQLGHASFDYYDGFERAMEVADELCNSGYVHGLIEANFESSQTIDEALNSSCTDYTENFKQWQCFHGVGHGIMYTIAKDHIKSIEYCKQLKSEFAAKSCINGVLMEEFIIIDHTGNHNTTNELSDINASICIELASSNSKRDCYFYAPTAFLEQNNDQFFEAINWCEQSESDYINTCVSGVGAQSMKDNITNPSFTSNLCKKLQTSYQSHCIVGAVSIFMNHHASSMQAKSLCENEFREFINSCQLAIRAWETSYKI